MTASAWISYSTRPSSCPLVSISQQTNQTVARTSTTPVPACHIDKHACTHSCVNILISVCETSAGTDSSRDVTYWDQSL